MGMLSPQGRGIPYSNIILCIGAWSGFYFILQYFNWCKSSEWNCRIVACVHGTLITVLSIYSVFVLGPSPLTDPGAPVNIGEWYTIIICVAFFVFDFAWCLYYQPKDLLILIHHVATIFCLVMPLIVGSSGGEVVVSIAATEITNPLSQFRWFLRESGFKDAGITLLVEVLFISLFFFMRIVFGTYFLYNTLSNPQPSLFIKVGGTAFCIISYIFTYTILRYIYRKYVLKPKWQTASNDARLSRGDNGMPLDKSLLMNGMSNGVTKGWCHQKAN